MDFSSLGADDSTSKSFDYTAFLKKEGPSLVTAATDAITSKKDDKTGTKKDAAPGSPDAGDKKGGGKAAGGSFFTDPLIGPVPGWGVLSALAAIGAGVWYKFHK